MKELALIGFGIIALISLMAYFKSIEKEKQLELNMKQIELQMIQYKEGR